MGFLGSLFGGGGPSRSEEMAAEKMASFSRQLMADYGTQFANQQEVLNQLKASYTPILAAGPSQQGMSAQELAALNTQAINTNAAAIRNAQQASRVAMAGQGGGAASPLRSGIQQQIGGAIASSGANALANAQLGITQANYAQGRQNYFNAAAGLDALAGKYNPAAYGGLGISSGEQAFGEARTVNQEKIAARNAKIAGAIGAGLGALTFGVGGIGALGAGESFGGGAGDFLSGGLNALAGTNLPINQGSSNSSGFNSGGF